LRESVLFLRTVIQIERLSLQHSVSMRKQQKQKEMDTLTLPKINPKSD